MINVNQITAQLARMPDQALQQYAALHKNDPYTVSLALSESNRRKQMRTASQMPQGEQPKVVDQQLAEMGPPQPAQAMPEDVGIGALPAGNMDFAEGGIVAFADGGVPGYQAGGMPTAAMQGGVSVPFGGYGGGPSMLPAQTGYEGMGIMEFLRTFGADVLDKLPSEEKERLKANEAKQTAAGEAAMRGYKPRSSMGQGERDIAYERMGMLPVATAATQNAPVADTGGAAPTVKTPPPAEGDGITRLLAPRATGAAPAQDKDYMTLLREAEERAGPTVDPLEAKRKALTQKSIEAEEAGLESLRADQASRSDFLKGREERIGKKEAELGKEKGKVEGLALLEAGLAMMQSKGRGLAGIAQGAGVGLKAYAAGVDRIKSAQEKLDEARDRMEELRQNQDTMDKREIRAAEKGIRQLGVQGERDLLEGLSQATGEDKKDIRAGVTSAMAMSEAAKDRASRLEAAGIAAAPGMARVQLAKDAQGDTAKARTEYGKLQTKVMSDLAKDPNYAMATDAQKSVMATTRLREALMNNPFLSSYAANIGFSGAPTTGTVRELDEVE